ncbi:hypothetical protein [Paractinoplanes maris]|uniref:hypothetical protein n=1 Tax=Paractinoplanes maris TaxID=1734446 RepID=UPI0020225EE5|nr:hypothetical protein [Actinoplanes maris]
MRKHICAVVVGILAVLGAPAVPAFAATSTTCVNLYGPDGPQPGGPDIFARACITWDDAPAGNAWTLKENRIWNPPGGGTNTILAYMYTNTGRENGHQQLTTGQTLYRTTNVVGVNTAKFEVWVDDYPSRPWCIYLIPRGSNIERRIC